VDYTNYSVFGMYLKVVSGSVTINNTNNLITPENNWCFVYGPIKNIKGSNTVIQIMCPVIYKTPAIEHTNV
jgi:hypothetical protein